MFASFLQSIMCAEPRKLSRDITPEFEEAIHHELPPSLEKYLVLDLDETLIHTKSTRFDTFDRSVKIHTGQKITQLYVAERPHLSEFLKEMSQLYTIIVFTASPKVYAQYMLKVFGIDKYVQKLYHRKDCKESWRGLSKDLSILNLPLKDLIFVDDQLINSYYQPENFLLLAPFDGQKDDRVLLNLIPFLKEQHSLNDLRGVDSRYVEYLRDLKAKERNSKLQHQTEEKESREKMVKRGCESAEKMTIASLSTLNTLNSEEKTVVASRDSFLGHSIQDLYQNVFKLTA